jgi:hypothetical protein
MARRCSLAARRYVQSPYANQTQPATVAALIDLAVVFTQFRVPYAVIGGFALRHWVGDHVPADLDIVVAPGRRTQYRLPRALMAIADRWPSADEPAFIPLGSQLAAVGDLSHATAAGKIDLVGTALPDGLNRRDLIRRRVWVRCTTGAIALCSLQDLVAIKSRTGRESDLAHVAKLIATTDAVTPPQQR